MESDKATWFGLQNWVSNWSCCGLLILPDVNRPSISLRRSRLVNWASWALAQPSLRRRSGIAGRIAHGGALRALLLFDSRSPALLRLSLGLFLVLEGFQDPLHLHEQFLDRLQLVEVLHLLVVEDGVGLVEEMLLDVGLEVLEPPFCRLRFGGQVAVASKPSSAGKAAPSPGPGTPRPSSFIAPNWSRARGRRPVAGRIAVVFGAVRVRLPLLCTSVRGRGLSCCWLRSA